ncbi:hypothetical protein N7456_011197 [Penicillium angulare]|uniref:F-box domain-containing protein n=1 Tax=Penicillium angulare TaxID=116970 RepID=A0A9W9ETI7_9EURO|nr:hypothetical protein N7456_011197 [Penicillium angulare]
MSNLMDLSDSELIIKHLASAPSSFKEILVELASLRQPAELDLLARSSTLGVLNRLPPEIITIILDMLDIQSMFRFSMSSYMGYAYVHSHRKYRDLITVALHPVASLVKLRVVHLHSVRELHGALRSGKCTYCPEYGAFLSLLSSERCCWECLGTNPSLKLISGASIRQYFALSEEELYQLPGLRNMPGISHMVADPNPSDSTFFNVKAAKAIALTKHGSVEKIAEGMRKRCYSTAHLTFGLHLLREPIPPDQDPLLVPDSDYLRYDLFYGGGSIPFPSLSKSGNIDHGFLCLGCRHTRTLLSRSVLPDEELAALVPSNCRKRRVIYGLEMRARARGSFLNHIAHCYGARQMAPWLVTQND